MPDTVCSHCGTIIPPGEDECPVCDADFDESIFDEDEEFPSDE